MSEFVDQVPDHIMNPEAARPPVTPELAEFTGKPVVEASVDGVNPYEKLFDNQAPPAEQPSPYVRTAEEIKASNQQLEKNMDLSRRFGAADFNVK